MDLSSLCWQVLFAGVGLVLLLLKLVVGVLLGFLAVGLCVLFVVVAVVVVLVVVVGWVATLVWVKVAESSPVYW